MCRALLRLLGALAALTPLFTASTAAASVAACPQQFGSYSSGNWPTACWRPYGSDSPFNRPLPAAPRVAADSGAIVDYMVSRQYHFDGTDRQFAFTSSGRGAIYYAQPSDPLVTIDCTAVWGPNTCDGANGVDVNGMSIHIPAGAAPDPNADHHLTVVDQTAQVEYDFDLAAWSADGQTLTVGAASQVPIGPDSGTGLGSQGTAAHFATLAGLITEPELAAHQIDHALAVSIPCTDGVVWPALGPFGYPCGQMGASPGSGEAAPPLGTLFQLDETDQQIADSGAPGWQQAIMTAMAHYGMYVNDTGGPESGGTLSIEKEADVSYTSVGGRAQMGDYLRSLNGTYWAPGQYWTVWGVPIDVSKLRVVDPCVDQGTCPTPVAQAARTHERVRARRPGTSYRQWVTLPGHHRRHAKRRVVSCRRSTRSRHRHRHHRRARHGRSAACRVQRRSR
jgi:hypothetical protein